MNVGKAKFKLSEETVKKSLAALDWPMLEQHFETFALSEEDAEQLFNHIRHYTNFLIKRDDPKRTIKRERFVDALRQYLETVVSAGAATTFDDLMTTVAVIEQGYLKILTTLGRCEAASLPADVQAAAALGRASQHWKDLTEDMAASLARKREVTPQSFRVEKEDGTSYSPDGVIEAINNMVAITLKLLAHRHN